MRSMDHKDEQPCQNKQPDAISPALLFITILCLCVMGMFSGCASKTPVRFEVRKIKEESSARPVLLEIKYRGEWIVSARRYYIRGDGQTVLHGEQLWETDVGSPLFDVIYCRNGKVVKRSQTIRW